MTETIRLTVKRTKTVTDTEQLLMVDLPRESGNIDNVESVLLEAYNITGTSTATAPNDVIPADVVLELTAGGSDRSGYLSYVFTSGAGVTTHMREQVNYLPLIPPGGLATRDHTTQTLAFRSPNATGMNLTNSQLRLLRFDTTARRYVPWHHWTDATFQLVITGTIRHMTVVKTKRL
jgi:hypothetical protein